MTKVCDHAIQLYDLLGRPDERDKWTAWDALTFGIHSAKSAGAPIDAFLKPLAALTEGRYWSAGRPLGSRSPKEAREPNATDIYPYQAGAVLGDLPSLLSALAILATWAIANNPQKLPSKTRRFRQAVYVRDLASILKHQGLRPRRSQKREAGFHLYQIVAITANVALGLEASDKVSADAVRKAVAGLH